MWTNWISCLYITVIAGCVPFRTILCIISDTLATSVCLGILFTCLYLLDYVVTVAIANMTYLAFAILLISYFHDVGNFLQNLH